MLIVEQIKRRKRAFCVYVGGGRAGRIIILLLCYSATFAPPTASSTISSCDSPSSSVAAVTLVVEIVAFVVVVFIAERGLCSAPGALPVGSDIPLSHLHNVIWLSPLGLISSIP